MTKQMQIWFEREKLLGFIKWTQCEDRFVFILNDKQWRTRRPSIYILLFLFLIMPLVSVIIIFTRK